MRFISLLGAVAITSRSSITSAFISPTSKSTHQSTLTTSNYHKLTSLNVNARGSGYGSPLENISEAVGNTPLVKISDALCPPGRTIYAKCEYFNPLSSVKDRLALAIIEAAEKDGSLKPGQTLVEATSGNTGIAIAMMCAQRGYPCVITMAEPFSVERRKLMRMLGAKVIVTPKAGKGTGMVEKAKELAEKHGWFLCHQFETDANWKFHFETTGPEICNDLNGKFDYWVTGYGTGGTFHGTAKYIKEKNPGTKIILAEPSAANLIGSGIGTKRNADGSPADSHPAFSAHPVQGWTPDFIPYVLETGLGLQDEMIEIPDGAAVDMSQSLARTQGILTGISGGATMWAAIETAKKAPEGSVLVAMLPDTGERYLSTPLFASINADMDEEELSIARSTPSHILEPPPKMSMSAEDKDRIKKAGSGVTAFAEGDLQIYDPNVAGKLQGTNDLMNRVKSGASFSAASPKTVEPASIMDRIQGGASFGKPQAEPIPPSTPVETTNTPESSTPPPQQIPKENERFQRGSYARSGMAE